MLFPNVARKIGLILGGWVAASVGFGQTSDPTPIAIKSGDVVSVVTTAPGAPYSGDYLVQADGAIYGVGFDRLAIAGESVEAAQTSIRHALRLSLKEKFVFLTLKSHQPDVIFVLGPDAPGQIPFTPPMTVRQVLAGAHRNGTSAEPGTSPTSDPETMKVEMIRKGKRVCLMPYGAVLRGTDTNCDTPLAPNDVLAILPEEVVRVWVTGNVHRPGELLLPVGSTVYQAIAQAGGIGSDYERGSLHEVQSKVFLRHGPDEREVSAQSVGAVGDVKLEAGDVVDVRTPEVGHATVMGEVGHPGRVEVRDGDTLLTAIGQAGGVSPDGTLHKVMLVRDGKSDMFDLSGAVDGTSYTGAAIRTGDLIFVQKNTNAIAVFGSVTKSGRFLLEDRKTYYLVDVLEMAGGLASGGSLRKVVVGRRGKDGKLVMTKYNLDEYVKDGKPSGNPVIQPGDAIFFGSSQGLSLGSIAQVLAPGVLLSSATHF